MQPLDTLIYILTMWLVPKLVVELELERPVCTVCTQLHHSDLRGYYPTKD